MLNYILNKQNDHSYKMNMCNLCKEKNKASSSTAVDNFHFICKIFCLSFSYGARNSDNHQKE